jgi:hypothetical protein
MISILDSLVGTQVEQARATNNRDAFVRLQVVFEEDNSSSINRTIALVDAARFAESEDDWKVIVAFLKTNYALFGRQGGLDTLLFEKCPAEILIDLFHNVEDGMIAVLDKMVANRRGVDRAEIAMVCRIFTGLDAVYDRVGGEENFRLNCLFVHYARGLYGQYGVKFPVQIWKDFKKYVPSNPPVSAPARPHYTA